MKVDYCLAALIAVMVVLSGTTWVYAIAFNTPGEPAGPQISVPADQTTMTAPEPSLVAGAILSLKSLARPKTCQSLESTLSDFALGKLKPKTYGRATLELIPTQWDAQVIPIPTQWDARIIPVASSGLVK